MMRSSVMTSLHRLARRSLSSYSHCQTKHPYITEAVQVGFLMGVGDVLAQRLVDGRPLNALDWTRTGQFAGLGLVMVGPGLRFWYGKLDKIVSKRQVLWKRTVKKVALDQFVVEPPFLATFIAAMSLLQGMRGSDIAKRLKDDFASVLLTNYTIWPATQLINFALVPLRFQVLFVQVVALMWNCYLSTKLSVKEAQVVISA